MAKTHPYTSPLERRLATDLLNASGIRSPQGTLLGDDLILTADHLAKLAEQANQYLENNEFSHIIATHFAQKMNKRGNATIIVTPEGQVLLEISYREKSKSKPSRTPRIPRLKDLRLQAKALGEDITQFGIKRKAIWEHLQIVQTRLAATRPTAQPETDPEADPGPMSAGPDETRVSPPPTSKPPKKGFMKTSDAIQPPVVVSSLGAATAPKAKPDLRKLVQDAKDVDIQSLLESEKS